MRLPARTVPALLASLLLAGCTGNGDEPGADPSAAPSTPSARASAGDTPDPARAEEAPRPKGGACYRLTHQQAIDPVVPREAVACGRNHTARTFAVLGLPTMVDGHLVAVDSARARKAPPRECPKRLGGFLGGTLEDLRLSMFRAVWFAPTLEEFRAGANWFRCDVVALAADGKLAVLKGKLGGVLDRPAGSQRYGMCGTAEPGTDGFERVACLRKHAWRAAGVVPLLGLAGEKGRYPGVDDVRSQGQGPCEQTGRDRAGDPLDFQWGYEWPSKQQWGSGTTYGICWVPDSA